MDDAAVLAQACADAMWVEDRTCVGLGIALERVGPGEAVLSLTVGEAMVNGHGLCHGGFIFTLADSAFAFACNTYGQRTVAQHCAVTFVRSALLGQKLTAHALERTRSDRSGIYDVTVRDEHDKVVAEFRGHSRTIAGSILGPSGNGGNV